jgi:hypothetical protein
MNILHILNHILHAGDGIVNVAVNITPEAHGLILWNFLGSEIASATYDQACARPIDST